jgi:hypothetical protein
MEDRAFILIPLAVSNAQTRSMHPDSSRCGKCAVAPNQSWQTNVDTLNLGAGNVSVVFTATSFLRNRGRRADDAAGGGIFLIFTRTTQRPRWSAKKHSADTYAPPSRVNNLTIRTHSSATVMYLFSGGFSMRCTLQLGLGQTTSTRSILVALPPRTSRGSGRKDSCRRCFSFLSELRRPRTSEFRHL